MSGFSKFKDSFDSLGYMSAGTAGAGTLCSFTAQRAHKEHHAVPRHSGCWRWTCRFQQQTKMNKQMSPTLPRDHRKLKRENVNVKGYGSAQVTKR